MKFKAVCIPAQYMALFRAIETARPCHKRLFSDPFAAAFLNRQQRWISKASAWPVLGPLVVRSVNRRRSGALSAGIARTRYIDELLEKCIAAGARQVIILGAGFDMRALRLERCNTLPVVEFDLPEMTRFKQWALSATTGSLPGHVRYYEADFNNQDLDHLFTEKQIDTHLPTAIIWEGVTNYLAPASVNTILRVLQAFAKGSSLIFTYIDKRVMESPRLFDAAAWQGPRSTKDEPQSFGFHPAELPHYLALFGFTLQDDRGVGELRRLYMPERGGLNRGYDFYRVAVARRK
jgi:methyltransferase (TIGR00027 family)